MIKVLCFGRFFDEVPGGMQRHVEHLFQALRNQVYYVHLVPSRNLHSADFFLHGFPVVRTRSLNIDGSLAISPGMITAARRLHSKWNFDLIHLHFPDPMSHLASMFLPASIPRIISWHADIIRQQQLLKIYRPWLNIAIKNAAAIIVATPNHISSSKQLREISDPKKVHVIPFGFDLSKFQETAPGAAVIRARFPGKLIFTLGRHVYYKGIDVLIKAMKRIDLNTTLLIGGTGPLTHQWRELTTRYGLNSRIHFLGMISETELAAYYQACDLFCLPATSIAEAFGIVQVEAMAAARPVVSTSLPSGVSFVNQHQRTGLVVPPSDEISLAEAINKLMRNDALRMQLGTQAQERAFQEFTLETMASRTLNIYERCLNQ